MMKKKLFGIESAAPRCQRFAVLAVLFTALLSTPVCAAAGTYNCDWVGGASGLWNNPNNWTCDIFCGPTLYYGDTVYVTIDGGAEQSYSVTANGDNSMTTLLIGANDTLTIPWDAHGLSIVESLTNRGTIQDLNLGAPKGSNLVIDGGGTMLMTGGRIDLHPPASIRNDDNRIEGYGTISGGVQNHGSIVANSSGNVLSWGGYVNRGLMKATNGGILRIAISGTTLDNSGGSIVSEAGSQVIFQVNSPIEGGSLQIDSGAEALFFWGTTYGAGFTLTNNGTLRVAADSMITMESIPISPDAEIVIENNAALSLAVDSVVNQGQIRLAGDSAASLLILQGSGDHVLSGGGEIALTSQDYSHIQRYHGNPSIRLVNQDNTINGEGYIDCPLVNDHIVVADHPNRTLFLRGGLTNNATLRVENNATMHITCPREGSGQVIVDGGPLELNNYEQEGAYKVHLVNGAHLDIYYTDFHASSLHMDASARLTIKVTSLLSLDGDFTFPGTDETAWDIDSGSGLKMTGGVGADIGQCSRWASLEVGGSDLGDVPEGYDGNFHLGKLVIGPGARVRLVDAVDNGNRDGTAGGPEALYVHTLDFRGEDGILNLNGLNLYYEELTVNGMYGSAEGRVIDEPCSAPMPMTAIQLLLLEKEIGVGPR